VCSLPLIKNILEWSKKTTIPGFAGVPIYYIINFIIEEIQKDAISTRANSMAFSFFLALFPAIIFLFTLLPLFPITGDYVSTLRESISGVLPINAEEYIFGIINDVVSIPRGGLFTVGFILALFFSSSGIASMMRGFEKSYEDTFKERNYFQRQWTAIKLTFLISILLFVSLVAIVLGKVILAYIFNILGLGASSRILINFARWILVILLFHAVVSSIYRYGAPTIERFHYFSPGATVATFFMIIVSLAFASYVNNFGTYNKLYGSIGALIVLLIWIQFNCTLLLIGYEINASVAVNKNLMKNDSKTLKDDPEEKS
jgi:membrane protein